MTRQLRQSNGSSSPSASSSASRPVYTPSESSSSVPDRLTPTESLSSGVDIDPDSPLPSIEPSDDERTPPGSTQRRRFDTPEFSITPPASSSRPTPSRSSSDQTELTPSRGGTIGSIDDRVRQLRLDSEVSVGQEIAQGVRPGITERNSSSSTTTSRSEATPSTSSQSSVLSSPLNSRRSTASGVLDGVADLTLGQRERLATPSSGDYLLPDSPSPNDRGSPDRTARRRSTPRRRSGSHVNNPPYDIADEAPPRERFHEPEFQRAFSNSKQLMRDLTSVLASNITHLDPSSAMAALHTRAGTLSNFQCPSTRTVGLVGDSGVGKSSLLNSLLDIPGLARTSNSGVACTCVVTEYHYSNASDFTVETEYFTKDEVKEQFTDLLRSYRAYHDSDDSSMSDDDLEDLEKRANVAEGTFKAAFRGRTNNLEQFLLDGSERNVLSQLLRWAEEISPGFSGSESTSSITMSDREGCASYLRRLTSDPQSEEESAEWPFIKKIKIFLNAYILSKGLILVDLPGLRDVNSARVKIAENHLGNCNEIFAVCPIGRAGTDAGVEAVFSLAERANLSRVGIICTKSDDIQAKEAENDWKGEESARIRSLTTDIESCEKDIEEVTGEIEELSAMDEDELLPSETQELVDLNRKKARLERTLRDRELQLKQHLMTTRNRKIGDLLQVTYGDRVTDGVLNVFCVSNRDYEQNRKKARDVALPYLHLSNIIDVRRHCISLVAQSQLRAAERYMNDQIPTLLGSVALWVQSGSEQANVQRKEEIRATLSTVERELRNNLVQPAAQIKSVGRRMIQQYSTQINQVMHQNNPGWTGSAERACRVWLGWHHMSFAAFGRNYGDHCTGAVGSHCWNDEAMESMVIGMRDPWNNLRQTIATFGEECGTLVETTFHDAENILSTIDEPQNDSIETLKENLRHRESILSYEIEQLWEEFASTLTKLNRQGFTGIRSSFMGQLMEDTYDECIAQYGSGSDRERKRIISSRIRDTELFESIRKQTKEGFKTVAGELQTKLEQTVNTNLAGVISDLNTLRDDNIALESERDPEFRRRVGLEENRIKAAMREIRDAIRNA